MSTHSQFTFSRDELEPLLSVAMTATLEKLRKDGIITKAQEEKFASEHSAILVTKKTIARRISEIFYAKNNNVTDDTVYVRVVKVEL